MGQAKFKCPRNLDSSKALESLWRPAVHLVGCIVSGMFEWFGILESDQRKDSNTQITLLPHAIGLAQDALHARGFQLPDHIVVHADNTAREQRNSCLITFGSILISTKRFKTVTYSFYMVGHTHKRLDQRFSVLAGRLKSAETLQSPQEFKRFIERHYQAARGYILIVEILALPSDDWLCWCCLVTGSADTELVTEIHPGGKGP